MRKLWAIARNLIAESLHLKVAVVFLLVLSAILLSLPFLMQGDGTLAGRIRTFLSYSLASLGGILSMLTVFVTCSSLSTEVSAKHVFLSATKPVARWEFVAGKWLGACMLNLVLLLIGGGMIYGIVRYMRTLEGVNPQDPMVLEHEVLTARTGSQLPIPVEDFRARVQAYVERLREEGRANIDDPAVQQEIRQQRMSELVRDYRTVEEFGIKEWRFENLFAPRDPNKYLHLRYKFELTREPITGPHRYFWVFGDRGQGASEYIRAVADLRNQFHSVEIPGDAIGQDRSLLVTLVNRDPDDSQMTWPTKIVFEEPGDLELLYKVGSFEGNFARALGLIYCRLMFLAAVGLFAASFLSFPVACLVAFTIYFSAAMAGFIDEAMGYVRTDTLSGDPVEFVSFVLKPLVSGFLMLIPTLSEFDGVPTLVDGRNVTLRWVLEGIAWLAIVRTGIVALAACLIFRQRELARVIV